MAAMVCAALLLAMCLILVGLATVQNLPTSLLVRDRMQMPPTLWRVLGFLDLVAASGLVIGSLASPALVAVSAGLAAAVLVVILTFQWRSHSPATTQAPVVVLLGLSALSLSFALAAA